MIERRKDEAAREWKPFDWSIHRKTLNIDIVSYSPGWTVGTGSMYCVDELL